MSLKHIILGASLIVGLSACGGAETADRAASPAEEIISEETGPATELDSPPSMATEGEVKEEEPNKL